ncbi:MAG: HAD hydrolase-like protein [Ignavibacteriae bacterium]|nr:HAD hydrolase-like protein [Ignavibacteriota bacterium]MCB9215686.1 HAD hydrolase-like protein [Ignavibacteria bacterium]
MGVKLKGLILSLDNVLTDNAVIRRNDPMFEDVGRLMRFLQYRQIKPIIFLNRPRMDINGTPLLTFLNTLFKCDMDLVIAQELELPMKPSPAGVNHILDQNDWQPNEVLYMGNSDTDVRTAINSHVLFVNVGWFHDSVEYGIRFESPWEVARFVDIFCLRDHLWEYHIDKGPLQVYALTLGGWQEQPYKDYYDHARTALKEGNKNTDFWIKYLTSTIYFSGIYDKANYFAPYPTHQEGSGNNIIDQYLQPFSKCFNKTYLKDIIVRHTNVLSSHKHQSSRSFKKQLESISLNKNATNPRTGRAYANPPLNKNKTVLVIDDFCTFGHSFETARAYIEATGASAICVACIKTLARSYEQITQITVSDPYMPNKLSQEPTVDPHRMNDHVTDREAPYELKQRIEQYNSWDWPYSIIA